MMWPRLLVAASLLLSACSSATAQAAPGVALDFSQKPVLIECEPNGGEPCFRLTFGFVDSNGRPVQVPLPATRELAARTEIEVDGQAVAPFYVAPSAGKPEPTHRPQAAILLLDASGSMLKDDVEGQKRFDAARQAAAAFLQQFQDGRDRVAIVEFSGRNVQSSIDGARFVDTRAQAQSELDTLAAPQARNNTALYSAVALAASRLGREAATLGATGRLIVLTDGANDVEPQAGDDRDLLSGNDGLERATRAVEASGVSVLPIGLGSAKTLDVAALTRLGTQSPLITLNPGSLRKAFMLPQVDQMRDVIATVKAPAQIGTRNLLAGRLLQFRAKLTLPDGTILVEDRPALWAAPPVATPSFHEEASEAEQRAYISSSRIRENSPWVLLRPVLVFCGFAMLLVFLWNVVPRWIWPDRYRAKLARPVRPEYWPGRKPDAMPGHYVPRTPPPGFEAAAYPVQAAVRQPSDNTIVQAATDFTMTKTRLN